MNYHLARRRSKGGRGLGGLLLLFGLLLLLGMLFNVGLMAWMWPLLVMAPGLVLFYLVKRLGKSATILTVPATMITALGLLMLYQNTLGFLSSWSYAWALVFPGSFGLGMAVYGELARKPGVERFGEGVAQGGVVLFLLGVLFFEVFLGIGGFLGGVLGALLIPLLLVGAGVYLLMRRGTRKRRPSHLGGSPRKGLGEHPNHVETPIFDDERERVR